jgi:hypothetical protein
MRELLSSREVFELALSALEAAAGGGSDASAALVGARNALPGCDATSPYPAPRPPVRLHLVPAAAIAEPDTEREAPDPPEETWAHRGVPRGS